MPVLIKLHTVTSTQQSIVRKLPGHKSGHISPTGLQLDHTDVEVEDKQLCYPQLIGWKRATLYNSGA